MRDFSLLPDTTGGLAEYQQLACAVLALAFRDAEAGDNDAVWFFLSQNTDLKYWAKVAGVSAETLRWQAAQALRGHNG